MTEELTVEGKLYISSKRAAQLSQYTQDYVGQLCRGGYIDAQRIGGLWYVYMDSLTAYKEKAEAYVPQPPVQPQFKNQQSDTLVSFDGKDYISAARASEITGYHQDYVGQLAREGKVLSRQVGNRWYVQREDLLTHKEEKDRLLAVVQSQSVGIPAARAMVKEKMPEFTEPLLTYSSDGGQLIPVTAKASQEQRSELLKENDELNVASQDQIEDKEGDVAEAEATIIPIRVEQKIRWSSAPLPATPRVTPVNNGASKIVRHPRKAMHYATKYVVLAATLGLIFAGNAYLGARKSSEGGATSTTISIKAIGDFLEKYVTTELIYKRGG